MYYTFFRNGQQLTDWLVMWVIDSLYLEYSISEIDWIGICSIRKSMALHLEMIVHGTEQIFHSEELTINFINKSII